MNPLQFPYGTVGGPTASPYFFFTSGGDDGITPTSQWPGARHKALNDIPPILRGNHRYVELLSVDLVLDIYPALHCTGEYVSVFLYYVHAQAGHETDGISPFFNPWLPLGDARSLPLAQQHAGGFGGQNTVTIIKRWDYYIPHQITTTRRYAAMNTRDALNPPFLINWSSERGSLVPPVVGDPTQHGDVRLAWDFTYVQSGEDERLEELPVGYVRTNMCARIQERVPLNGLVTEFFETSTNSRVADGILQVSVASSRKRYLDFGPARQTPQTVAEMQRSTLGVFQSELFYRGKPQ
jgi:hypothetical protein